MNQNLYKMNNDEAVIWIATPSYLIRKALVALLKQHGKNFRIHESAEQTMPTEQIVRYSPDILIIDSAFFPLFNLNHPRSLYPFIPSETKICGLILKNTDAFPVRFFDKEIRVYATPDEIWETIQSALAVEEHEEHRGGSEDLTEREKEILIELAKGLTNKEIGDRLNLSVHTVISHRKNITRKLDIKSSSGLTVYAIMNNLISIQDIRE